jgi:hypothetical protein
MTVSHYIVSLVGVGYTIVGIEQYFKGNVGSGIMWLGYGFSQIGLYMQLAK